MWICWKWSWLVSKRFRTEIGVDCIEKLELPVVLKGLCHSVVNLLACDQHKVFFYHSWWNNGPCVAGHSVVLEGDDWIGPTDGDSETRDWGASQDRETSVSSWKPDSGYTGLDCGLDYWTGLMEVITGSKFKLNVLISPDLQPSNQNSGQFTCS